jgi:CheY-like chemotaxis protein
MRPRVLVADDEPVSRLVGVRLFERLGCRVVGARDGSVALDLIAAQTFELLLMDLEMPRLPGLELARRLSAHPQRPRIVALTGLRDPELESRCAKVGVDTLMVKPITPTQARALLDELAPPPSQVLDLELLDGTSCGDPVLMAALAEDYFEFVARATMQLEEALGTRNQELIGKVAHRMAGGFGVAGARRGVKLARRLEMLCAGGRLADEPELPGQVLSELGRAERALRTILERANAPAAGTG